MLKMVTVCREFMYFGDMYIVANVAEVDGFLSVCRMCLS